MDYFEDDLLAEEMNFSLVFTELKSKLQKQLKELDVLAGDDLKMKDKIKQINNTLEWKM